VTGFSGRSIARTSVGSTRCRIDRASPASTPLGSELEKLHLVTNAHLSRMSRISRAILAPKR